MTFGVIWSNLITKARSRSQRTRKIEWHFFQWSFAMRMMMKAVVLLRRRRRSPRSARHEGCEKKKAMSSSTSSSGKVRKDGRKEGAISVTRLGAFWKFLATYFLTKVAQIIGYYLGYCGKQYCLSKKCCGSFLDIVWKIWATFIPTSGHTGCNRLSQTTFKE